MISVNNITKSYGRRAVLKSVDFAVPEGSIAALMGHNGSGKTTLIKVLLGLVRPDSGAVSIHGAPINGDCNYRNLIGYMPQSASFPGHLTVSEVTRLVIDLRNRPADLDYELYHAFGLQDESSTSIRYLSGGTRQKLSAALATLFRPRVMILDEPTASLDPVAAATLKYKLRSLRTQGTTIIFITHDAIEAEKIIQRVGILHAGRLVALGTPGALKQQVDQQLRLELFFAPETPPALPPELAIQPLDAGRWMVYVERSHLESVMSCLDQNQIDDFRFYSATLEDLYIHYATDETAAG